MSEDAVTKAKNLALKLLSYSQKSERDIVGKLKAKGFDEKTITCAVEELKSFSLIDDRRFAIEWARAKVKHNLWGRNRIINGLIEKGIAKDTANTALEEVEHEISEEETIKKAFEKWLKRQGHGSRDKGQEKEKPKAFRHLISRGFQPSLINQTLNKYYKQTGEDFDNSI